MSKPREVTVGGERFRRILTGLTRRWELYDNEDARWIPHDECESGLLLDALLAMQAERDESELAVGMLCDERDWFRDKIDKVVAERDEARGMVFDVFTQACQVDYDRAKNGGIYDHMALSA